MLNITCWFRKRHLAKLTVLVYANGNCDLEPEISKSLLDMESVGSGKNTNVVIQIARAPFQLVRKFRPNYLGPVGIDGDWCGVRRYLVPAGPSFSDQRKFSSKLLADLGPSNMADPETLRDFICWGIRNYPARHYMLALAGHGSGFVGAMTDFTRGCPQMMSISGINAAITAAVMETGRRLDILLLDSCYMNMLEILYELGAGPKAPGFIVTSEATPLEGLPYESLMKVVKSIKKNDKLRTLVRNIVLELNRGLKAHDMPLFAVRSSRPAFRFLKRSVSNIGVWAVRNNMDLAEHSAPVQPDFPALNLKEMSRALVGIGSVRIKFNSWLIKSCLHRLINFTVKNGCEPVDDAPVYIYFPDKDHFSIMERYYSALQFVNRNHWLYLLGGKHGVFKPVSGNHPRGGLPQPVHMPLEGVHHVLTAHSPGISEEEIERVIHRLKWTECTRLQGR